MCFQDPSFLFSASWLKRPSSPSPRRAFVSRRSSTAKHIIILSSSVDFVVEQRRRVGVDADATPTAHAQLRRYGRYSHSACPATQPTFMTTLPSIPESHRGAWDRPKDVTTETDAAVAAPAPGDVSIPKAMYPTIYRYVTTNVYYSVNNGQPPSIVAGEHEPEEIDAAVCRAAGDPRICVWTRRLSLSQSAPSEKCLK